MVPALKDLTIRCVRCQSSNSNERQRKNGSGYNDRIGSALTCSKHLLIMSPRQTYLLALLVPLWHSRDERTPSTSQIVLLWEICWLYILGEKNPTIQTTKKTYKYVSHTHVLCGGVVSRSSEPASSMDVTSDGRKMFVLCKPTPPPTS